MDSAVHVTCTAHHPLAPSPPPPPPPPLQRELDSQLSLNAVPEQDHPFTASDVSTTAEKARARAGAGAGAGASAPKAASIKEPPSLAPVTAAITPPSAPTPTTTTTTRITPSIPTTTTATAEALTPPEPEASPSASSIENAGRASENLPKEASPVPLAFSALPPPLPTTTLSQPGDPLPRLTKKIRLPKLTVFHLQLEQLRHPLFLAIIRVLVARGNRWHTGDDLVEAIRYFALHSLGGRTPRSSIQGAISTALTTAHALRTFEPLEKLKMSGTTYYRVAPRVLDPTLHNDASDSDATESDSNASAARTDNAPAPALSLKTQQRQSAEVSKARTRATIANAKRKSKLNGSEGGGRSNKRKPEPRWSDTLSSDSSEEDTRQQASTSRHHTTTHHNTSNKHQQPNTGLKRTRSGSPRSNPSSRKSPARKNSIPNGLKKLPKGYVYDTEINQSALMNISVDPLQTGEYIRQMRGKNAQENDFPDRRGEYGVDLTQEPSMFALEQQTGYTYPRLRNSGRERLPKGNCEDGYAIADLKHNGAFLGRLFCITDGHGGRACSSFVVATIPGAMQVILGKYRPADLSLPAVQELVKTQITEAVRLIDKEYLDYKKQQYLLFKSGQIPNDPGSDGTTLIVNIFIDKWIICLNLGDSRTMMGSRDPIGRWNVDFYSEDHTPSLERLAQSIYANGGEFVTHDDKVIKFDPNHKNDKKHRQSLKEARIRVRDGDSNQYGIPFRTKNGHCASVNLGACIGDVLYKLDPVNPVLSCKPDITFIDVTNIQQGFLLMASDGLWDYVQRGGKIQDQNASVCQFVGDKLDRGWNHQRIVYTLSDRESANGLYSDSIQEYDDFTAILVTFNKQQLLHQQQQYREYEQRQFLLQQQRLQEQQILHLHQQQVKQREVEQLQRLQQLQIEKEKAELEQLHREQELVRTAEAEAEAKKVAKPNATPNGDDHGNGEYSDADSDLTEPDLERGVRRNPTLSSTTTATAMSPPTPTPTLTTTLTRSQVRPVTSKSEPVQTAVVQLEPAIVLKMEEKQDVKRAIFAKQDPLEA